MESNLITPPISKEEFGNKIHNLNQSISDNNIEYIVHNEQNNEHKIFDERQEYVDYLNKNYGYNYVELPLNDARLWANRFFVDEKQKVKIHFKAFSPLEEKFFKLHEEIIDKIIVFCKENNVMANMISLTASCVSPSIEYGEWTPCTDSAFGLYDEKDNSIIFSI